MTMTMAAAAADVAHTTARVADRSALDSSNITRIGPPHELKFLCYAWRICMPLIEWTCVAGLPTLLCLQIIIAHAHIATASASPWFVFVSEQSRTRDDVSLLQWSLLVLVVTSILSLVAILVFGDIHANGNDSDDNPREQNKRGFGIVMGSHLVPLLNMALLLSILPDIEWDNTSCRRTLEAKDSINDDDRCSDFMHQNSMVERIAPHLKFASLGGISFVLSFWWMNLSPLCNHRTFNKRRVGSNDASTSEICSSFSLRICWRIHLSLLIIYSAICAFKSQLDYVTTLLGIHHLLLIMVYDNNQEQITTDEGHWQDAFTPGEWMVVSTLISSLVGEYIFEYYGILHIFDYLPSLIDTKPIHLTVAHAGLVGCLVGVTICSYLKKLMLQSNTLIDNNKRAMGVTVSVVAVFGVAMGFIEVALNSRSISLEQYCDNESTSCAPLILSSTTISWRWIPLPIQWLFHFLLSKVDVPSFGRRTSLLRVAVLAYWFTILVVCLPIASFLSTWTTAPGRGHGIGVNMNNHAPNHRIPNVDDDRARKKRIIVARKYFHLVAIALFTPITYFDPVMMSLSYAIAISLLIVIEMVRIWTVKNSNNFKRNCDDTVIATPALTWNDFYMSFLDEKDASAAKGGLVVTHIALIFGCAFPLWVHQCLLVENISTALPDKISLLLLPFLGLIALGVGDSMSAICGVHFGRLHWPGGSSRTLEGSLGMFLSMMFAVMWHVEYQRFSVPMAVMTLVEASTSQVDNLYLPIAGSTLVLLWSK
jgi:dolichol kinase